jgi:hypothetical protein
MLLKVLSVTLTHVAIFLNLSNYRTVKWFCKCNTEYLIDVLVM